MLAEKPRRKKIKKLIIILIILGFSSSLNTLLGVKDLFCIDTREDNQLGLEETDAVGAVNALYLEFDSEDDPDNFDEMTVTSAPGSFTSKMGDVVTAIAAL